MSQSKAKSNYSRICHLLIGKGGNAFRSVLQTKIKRSHPYSTLASFLNANKDFLSNLQVIRPIQLKLLFPAKGSPDLKDFDITLLTILLQDLCKSSSHEISTIKEFRNKVSHLPSPEINDSEFERLWRQIKQPLIKLGIPKQEIDDLKKSPFTSEEESYIQKLKEWKERDDELKSNLKDVERKVDNTQKTVNNFDKKLDQLVTENVKSSEINNLAKFFFKEKLEALSKSFQNNTREWFFEKFENWLDDKESRVMILTAGPGVGKSVLSAKICELYKESRQLAACHFCDFGTSDSRDPHKILQSLASQMCDNVGGFREKLHEALSRQHSRDSLSNAFRVLLNDPLQALGKTEPMLIVVDALDESKTANQSEFFELVSEKFSQLPKWIKIFMTSRPELQVKEKLKVLNPLEILPDNHHQEWDLMQFIQSCLPNISECYSLVKKCQGSFLYAYYLVNADEHDISGFYEKQFKRLETELQSYEQVAKVSIFKTFVNVVAASDEPLPFRILFTCMGLPDLEFKIRKTITGIMSEILPVYDDCLTVFHKSLRDWLRLDGYDEHAYAADVADGEKRLWCACKKVYTDIVKLCSVSNLEISSEQEYALKNGFKYLIKIDEIKDFQWLVNVKINYLIIKHKFVSCLHRMYEEPFNILQKYKSSEVYEQLSQLYTVLQLMNNYIHEVNDENLENLYLQCFASKQFCFVHNATINTAFVKDAREILNDTNMFWLEKVTNKTYCSFEIISSAIDERFPRDFFPAIAISLSPDNKLLACKHEKQVVVYELPRLKIRFRLQDLNSFRDYGGQFVVFSPDSSYFLLNSLKKCISIKDQREVSFIEDGPIEILCCSFSSCGAKLVTVERNLIIKLWDVKEKKKSVQTNQNFPLSGLPFISINNSFIFLHNICGQPVVLDEKLDVRLTLKEENTQITCDNCIQLICPPCDKILAAGFGIEKCYKLLKDKNILCATKYCSKPFVWKGEQLVMSSNGGASLLLYDYIDQKVVDTFTISCLPSYKSVDYISHLGENNFLLCLDRHFLFVLSLERSCEFSAFSFINDMTYPIFCALSPDNLYVACCYGSPVLRIVNVDNGETLQTVVPKQKPISCWWSELYLWVVCEGSVVFKYPYTPTQTQALGNNIKKCSIDCQDWRLLKFVEGVLVTSSNEKISIAKVCGENLSPQQTLDSKFTSSCDVEISSDGCAVMLYGYNGYEIWEKSVDKWELLFNRDEKTIKHACLTGKRNLRVFLRIVKKDLPWREPFKHYLYVTKLFSDASQVSSYELPMLTLGERNIYGGFNLLICRSDDEIFFIRVSNGEVINSIYVGEINDFFFVPSKCLLLLFRGSGVIEHFKVHNLPLQNT